MGLGLLVYPLGFLIKTGLFRLSKILFFIFYYFENKGTLTPYASIVFLKFII
jgi:hypothetical protein